MYHRSKAPKTSKKSIYSIDLGDIAQLRSEYEIPEPDVEFFRGTIHLDPKVQEQDAADENHEDLDKMIEATSDKKLKRKLRNRRSAQLSRLRKKKKRHQLEMSVAHAKREQHLLLSNLVRQSTLNKTFKEQVQRTLELIYTSPLLSAWYNQLMVSGSSTGPSYSKKPTKKNANYYKPVQTAATSYVGSAPPMATAATSALYEKASAMMYARNLLSGSSGSEHPPPHHHHHPHGGDPDSEFFY